MGGTRLHCASTAPTKGSLGNSKAGIQESSEQPMDATDHEGVGLTGEHWTEKRGSSGRDGFKWRERRLGGHPVVVTNKKFK